MEGLSGKQLKMLGSTSRRAYKFLVDRGLASQDYEDWRRTFTADHADGVSSWKGLKQVQFVPLVNAFKAVFGGRAMKDRTPRDKAEKLRWSILDRLAHWEAPRPYVAKIIRDKAGRPWITASTPYEAMIEGLEEDTLSGILYTLQDRLRKLTARSAPKGCPVIESHRSRSTVPPDRLKKYRGDVGP